MVASGADQGVAELAAANQMIQTQIQDLRSRLWVADARLSAAEADRRSTSEERKRLAAERDSLTAELRGTQEKLAAAEAAQAQTQQQNAQLQDKVNEAEATYVASQVKINDLTEQLNEKSDLLDSERQLLVHSKDVTELMAARNLHIVDVVDTDARGKARPTFGRIFFTEGKSLVFYAYDLNEAKMRKANYQYRIWAKREGADRQIKRLGVFYSDDKVQRRWVFKCEDPKVLSEIDSVFVTLEAANGDSSQPKGPNLMYAYLRGQPNHP
jgi:DNA repair exonuclease SbcCD ATPase subunit